MIHKIKHRLHKHRISFKNALEGLVWVFRTQPNYIVHLSLSSLSVVFGFMFAISRTDWLILILLVTVGLVIETINSALEQTLDCVSLELRDDIKIAKDVSAAAMLIYSIGASIGAFVIFGPYFFY